MASAARLRELFQRILQSNLASLRKEVGTLLQYTLKHEDLGQTDDLRDKVQEVLKILLEAGEDACRGFLETMHRNSDLYPRILHILKEPRGDKAMFELAVEDLGLGKFLQHKLTLSSVQSLLCEELSDVSCHSMKDISMNFLRHLMALNMQEAFRSVDFNREAAHSEQETSDNISRSVHPLDVLCALLHCSDNFLRQEIIRRMSMCRVPVPLLLPAGEGREGTFLLWAMRGVMKPSIDHSTFIEDNVVNIPLPVFSFVSLGECRCKSIAKIIHQTLPTAQQRNQDDVMRWGDMPRCLSDGLVEISWYFPSDQTDLTLLNVPFAVTNLYGDLQSNMNQFHFLTNVSSAMFILTENMTEQQWNLLLKAEGDKKNYYFIVQDQLNQDSSRFCSQFSDFGLDKQNVLVESHESFQENLQLILRDIMQSSPKQMTLSEMSVVASNLNFCSDENQPGCEYARLHSLDLTTNIINAAEYNEGNIKQQQNLKMQISEIEKEFCRLRHQGELHTMDYKSKLRDDMYDLQAVQNLYNQSRMTTNLCNTFTFMNKEEQKYFLQWKKFQTFSTSSTVSEIIQEDVFCKMAQMYEAEVIAESPTETRLCSTFPKAAADLLLQGIPLELIDGDTNSIHQQWITDVLAELETRRKEKCRMRVLSVLGVQGTGKSTLLNTMFGLQFPMTHRQCTRGAVMSLIKVEEKDLGCDFLVVIDCEGLRDLDRASAEESFDHDNELATLVVGLSDIAIINMALGSTSEMRDILQIVIHALLRMKATGQNPHCLLVYQTMEGASPEDKTMIEDKEMLRLQIEKNSNFLQYNDTIECNTLGDYVIIPPFDLETSCYGAKVEELKRYLLQVIKYISQPASFRDVKSFAGDIKALWNSVKYENYIFRFKNILEGTIYKELYEKYLELEWILRRKMHRRWEALENSAYSLPPGELHTSSLVQDVLRMLNEEAQMMQESLQVYFTEHSEDPNSYVARKFEGELMEKIKSLKSHLEAHYMIKCSIIKPLKFGLLITIVEDFIQEQDPDETNIDVTLYWNHSLAKYKSMILKGPNVEEELLRLLRQDMRTKGSFVTELIHNISSLSEYVPADVTYDENYVNKSFMRGKCDHMENCLACHQKRISAIRFLFEKCHNYVQEVVESGYDPVHGMTLLNMVNKVIRDDPVPYTVLFELNLKLQILSLSAPQFQKMHDDFLGECSAQIVDHGAEGIHYLKQILQDKRIAKHYCQYWVKPAVELKVKKMLQQQFTNDYTNHMCAVMKRRRRPTEAPHELRCVHHAPVEDTLENICHRYTDRNEIQILLTNIISSVIEDIRKVLNHPDVLKSGNVSDLLASVCSVLEEGISGGRENIADAPFCVTVSSVLQCSSYLDFFVKKLEKQIQEEFSSRSIEELYTEIHWTMGRKVGQGSSCGEGHSFRSNST